MFIAALFTITKIWKQPKCPSTDECIMKIWYIYAVKKKKILPFATRMDLQNIMLSKIIQGQLRCDITYMWNLKNNAKECI